MVDSVRRISAIVADTSPMDQRADAVLDELAAIVAYDAAQIAVWNPRTSTHHTVASRGYTEQMRVALNGPPRYRTDRVWGVLEQRAEPVFWKDCPPFDRRDSEFYVEAVEAHGFREGGTMLLRAIDGVYLGMLLLNLEAATPPPADEVREMLGIVGGAGMTPPRRSSRSGTAVRLYALTATAGRGTRSCPRVGTADPPKVCRLGLCWTRSPRFCRGRTVRCAFAGVTGMEIAAVDDHGCNR